MTDMRTTRSTRSRRLTLWLAATLALLLPGVRADAARGGPDGGGWSWADSLEPGLSNAVESTLSTTVVTSALLDEGVYAINLSIPFTLYGVTSSTVWLSSNGWLTLVNPGATTAPVASPIPVTGAPDALIALYWADLHDGGNSFVIEGPTPNGHQILMRATDKASGELVQFVVQFYRDGAVKVWYILLPATPSATLGIENETGGFGTELHYGPSPQGGFRLLGDLAVLYYPISTLSCGLAAPIACSGAVSSTTLGGTSLALGWGCSAASYTGHEQVHVFTTTSLQRLDAALSGLGARDLDLFLMRPGCDSRLDCVALGADALSQSLLTPGTWYLAVDGKTPADDGPYTLTTTCGSISTPIACGGTVAGNLTGAGAIDSYGCTPLTDNFGPEAIHDFTLAAPQTILVTLTPAAPFDVLLVDRASIAPVTMPCRRWGDSTLGWINLPAGDYSLIVDGPTGSSGSFSLSLGCQTGVPTTAIDCGQSFVGAPQGPNFIDDYDCLGTAYDEREAYYRFAPTARVSVTATVDDPFSWDIAGFVEADLPTTCFAGDPTAITLFNVPPGGSYVYALDSKAGTPVSSPSLSLACTPLTLPPLACDSTLGGLTPAASQLALYPCYTTLHDGGEVVYSFVNPVQQDIGFGLSGLPPGVDLDVAVIDDTVPFVTTSIPCLASGDVMVRIANAPAGPYLVSVDGAAITSGSTFRLSAACGSSALDCATAPSLSCNAVVAGDTTGGTSRAFFYGTEPDIYNGPELIYHFFNPIDQDVSFLLRNPADPRLDLLLVGPCNTANLLYRRDSDIVAPGLDPGDYWLVVDGREEIAGSFELVTFCGPPALDPPVLVQSVDPGTCHTETKTLYFPPFVPEADVLFSIDLSASMGDEIAALKAGFPTLATELDRNIANLELGLASFVEYDTCYTDTVCQQSSCPSTSGAYAFRVDEPLTRNVAQVQATLAALPVVGGGKESYTRSLWESWNNRDIDWRDCAAHLWVSLGDEVPVDCNVEACLGGNRNTGRDPGPDLATGTGDDIELLPALDGMAANAIALLAVDSSDSAPQQALWDCLARRTGGRALLSDRLGNPDPGSELLPAILDAVIGSTRLCPALELVPVGPQASWVSITPGPLVNAPTPWYGQFSVTWCVPPGTPAGAYDVDIEARCTGRGACAPSVLATQDVRIDVPATCAAPTAVAGPDLTVCLGNAAWLDGSASGTGGCPSGALYEWRDGAIVVRPASPTPTWNPPTTAAGTTTYTLVVSCAGFTGCSAQDDIAVTVEDCTVPVRWGSWGARTLPGGAVAIGWRTLEESGTLGFAVERAGHPEGPFAELARLEARGSLSDYELSDPAPDPSRPWYRIVEHTSAGPGDATPAFTATTGTTAPGAASRRRASSRNRGR